MWPPESGVRESGGFEAVYRYGSARLLTGGVSIVEDIGKCLLCAACRETRGGILGFQYVVIA